MNFLAHLHLADGDAGDMAGGVVADFVRHPEVAALPADIRRGVHLHRLIDGFTDRHPVTLRSIARVAPALGWFGGVAIDIYYDHILAREWARYSAEPLAAFARRCYDVLEARFAELSEGARDFVRPFIDDDRLSAYATREGIARTLARVSDVIAERIPNRAVRLADHMPLLVALDGPLAAAFHAFYPDLRAFVAERRAAL